MKRTRAVLKEMFASGAVPTGSSFSDLLDTMVLGNTPTTLTIVGGEVTRTQLIHRIDTESQAGSDDLDTIDGGVDGDLVILLMAEATRLVTVKHQTGNIGLAGGSDCLLNAWTDVLGLLYNSSITTYKWMELFRITT